MRNIITANKKGQAGVNNLSSPILVLIIAAVFLVLGLVIMEGINDVNGSTAVTVTNETGAYINATGYTLVGAAACGFNTPVITNAVNTTSNITITAANYTVSSAGILTNITTEIHDPVIFSYTYLWGDEACQSSESAISGVGSFGDFWEIIVLAIVAALVIGILLTSFGRGKR